VKKFAERGIEVSYCGGMRSRSAVVEIVSSGWKAIYESRIADRAAFQVA